MRASELLNKKAKSFLCVGLFAFGLTACSQAAHHPQASLYGACDKKFDYDINFNRFDETAQQIAHATGCFVETDTSVTGSVKPNAVKGNLSPRQAIALAIKGTSLKVVKQKNDLIKVEKSK